MQILHFRGAYSFQEEAVLDRLIQARGSIPIIGRDTVDNTAPITDEFN